MAQQQSSGVLLYRNKSGVREYFLVHPGGPFWKNKDEGAWSIPKGEFTIEEDPLEAARREFKEETGHALSGNFIALNPVKQKSGKIVHAWALEGDIDPSDLKCNTFKIEWPPRSGKFQEFPEVDKGEWFSIAVAKQKINVSQAALLDDLNNNITATSTK